MVTVPAHSFCDPTRWCVIAAARFMPGVCGVFMSSAWAGMTTTPCVRQSGWLPGSVVIVVEDRGPAGDLSARSRRDRLRDDLASAPTPRSSDGRRVRRKWTPQKDSPALRRCAGEEESHFVDGGRFDQ